MELLTRLEEAILIAIWRLKENAYGVTINKEVSDKVQKKYSMGALYFTLDQLYKKGYITKSSGAPTPSRGGRRKIFYALTPEGKIALVAVKNFQTGLWDGLSHMVFEK